MRDVLEIDVAASLAAGTEIRKTDAVNEASLPAYRRAVLGRIAASISQRDHRPLHEHLECLQPHQSRQNTPGARRNGKFWKSSFFAAADFGLEYEF